MGSHGEKDPLKKAADGVSDMDSACEYGSEVTDAYPQIRSHRLSLRSGGSPSALSTPRSIAYIAKTWRHNHGSRVSECLTPGWPMPVSNEIQHNPSARVGPRLCHGALINSSAHQQRTSIWQIFLSQAMMRHSPAGRIRHEGGRSELRGVHGHAPAQLPPCADRDAKEVRPSAVLLSPIEPADLQHEMPLLAVHSNTHIPGQGLQAPNVSLR